MELVWLIPALPVAGFLLLLTVFLLVVGCLMDGLTRLDAPVVRRRVVGGGVGVGRRAEHAGTLHQERE